MINDDDDDDCQFVEHLKHLWKTGAVSISMSDGKTMKNTKKKKMEMDDGAVTGLKTGESWISCEKLKKTQIDPFQAEDLVLLVPFPSKNSLEDKGADQSVCLFVSIP